MRRMALLLALFALPDCVGNGSRDTPSFLLAPNDVWIQDVTLISPERETPLAHAHVVVRGERIAWVGDSAPEGTETGIVVVEGAGKQLVPGLIDGHVHLASVPGMSAEHVGAMPELAAAYYEQLPRSYLYFGFTTVVDVNVTNREAVERVRSAELGPMVLDCGNGLVLANGYPMANRPFPERFERYPNFLYDPRQADSIPIQYRPENHSPEAAVGRVADGGGRCVKAFYESGGVPGRWPVPTVEMMRQVRDLSHARGIPLLLHANSLEAHRFAAEVGVDAVVHGLWNWQSLGPDTDDELPLPVRETLDAGKRAGIGYMPSMRVLSGIGDLFDPAFLDHGGLAHVVPPSLLAWYRTPEAQWYAEEMTADGESVERLRAVYLGGARKRGTTYLAAQGGRIVFGSDTPSDTIYTNPPGFNGYLELREMEVASISPRQILASATIENARLFHIEDRYGTIQAGKIANLLLLRDDALVSTSAYDTLETVILEGRVVPRAELSAASAR
jgi:imidazolonepropionase-like amidohydrolase